VAAVRQIRADLCFIGACSLAAELGVGVFDCEEAALKRAMIEASGASVVAALADKLGTRAPFFVAEAGAIQHLIVESGTDKTRTAPFAAQGTIIHVAGAAAND